MEYNDLMTNTETGFTHPELHESEVFFTNADLSQFNAMEFKSKRLGKVAYDGKGNIQHVENWFPVFLNNREVDASGFSLMELRRKQRIL